MKASPVYDPDLAALARLPRSRARLLGAGLAAYRARVPDGRIAAGDFHGTFGRELDALAEARDEAGVLAACRAAADALGARGAGLADALLAGDALGEAAAAAFGDDPALVAALRAVAPLRARAYADAWLPRERSAPPTGDRSRRAGPVPHLRLGGDDGLVGHSPAIERLRHAIARAARTAPDVGVLISGEAGTGKERAARALHAAAGRSGPFVAVRCATLAPYDVEGARFAQTGAGPGRVDAGALLASAWGGTLFLREVSELGMDVQAALVRALDAARPGDGRSDGVLVVASTRRDPAAAVAEGRLREDLVRGLVPLAVPPLRERREDVPLLVEHFLGSYCARRGGCLAGVSREALDALVVADWPGNVRELRAVVDEAVVAGRDATIGLADLPPRLRGGATGGALAARPAASAPVLAPLPTLAEAEADLIRLALAHHRGNKVAAARALGISRHKLYTKLREMDGA